jgi:thioredoxin 1
MLGVVAIVVPFQIKIKKITSFDNLIHSDKPVLVDFYATWCGPCQMLAPVLKQVKDNLGDRIKIIKIDVDKNQNLASKYQVRGVPTMLLFQEGKQLWRQSGVLSKEEITRIILEKTNK